MGGKNLDAMTAMERAHAIVELAVVRTYNLHASDEYNRQCTVEDIVTALHAERQAVWEEILALIRARALICQGNVKASLRGDAYLPMHYWQDKWDECELLIGLCHQRAKEGR